MSKLTPQSKTAQRARRHLRLRARVIGTAERPRLAVYRSNKFVYAQLIDDDRAHTIASSRVTGKKVSQMEQAKIVGTEIAAAAKKLGVTKVVFIHIFPGAVPGAQIAPAESGGDQVNIICFFHYAKID